MMEHGNSGNYAKNVAKDILDQYFGFYTWDEDGNKFDQNGNQVDDSGVIIKTAEEIAEEQAQQEGASQAQQGDSDAASGTEPASTPAPTTDRGSDIPDTPFTGEESSAPEGGDSSQAQEEPTPSPQPPPQARTTHIRATPRRKSPTS